MGAEQQGPSFRDERSGIVARSNGSREGNDALSNLARICREADQAERDWVSVLRSEGVKLAHPDDGWVKRAAILPYFHPRYPRFNDGLAVGDVAALGRPDDFRLVRITAVRPWMLDPTLTDYFYEPLEVCDAR